MLERHAQQRKKQTDRQGECFKKSDVCVLVKLSALKTGIKKTRVIFVRSTLQHQSNLITAVNLISDNSLLFEKSNKYGF